MSRPWVYKARFRMVALSLIWCMLWGSGPAWGASYGSSTKRMTIVDALGSIDYFSRFYAALDTAGLLPLLAGQGPYTVLAPSNDAFLELAEGTWNDLLKPENRRRLKKILSRHIIPGRLMGFELGKSETIKTLGGEALRIKHDKSSLLINGRGRLLETDIVIHNGIIHALDRVLFAN